MSIVFLCILSMGAIRTRDLVSHDWENYNKYWVQSIWELWLDSVWHTEYGIYWENTEWGIHEWGILSTAYWVRHIEYSILSKVPYSVYNILVYHTRYNNYQWVRSDKFALLNIMITIMRVDRLNMPYSVW